MQYFPKFSGIQTYTDYKHSIQVNILCFLLYGQLVLPHVAPTGEKQTKTTLKNNLSISLDTGALHTLTYTFSLPAHINTRSRRIIRCAPGNNSPTLIRKRTHCWVGK